jgi:hypothetical protein
MTTDDLEERLAKLRADWPVPSMVHDVMAQIDAAATKAGSRPPRGRRRQLALGVAVLGLLACLGLGWTLFTGGPRTLQAAIEEGLARAESAHIVFLAPDDQGQLMKVGEIWYRRGEGYRSEHGDEVEVDDGTHHWLWSTEGGATGKELTVLRRPGHGFWAAQIVSSLALPDLPSTTTQEPAPGLDRVVNGEPWRAFIVREILPPGARFADGAAHRAVVLADPGRRIHAVIAEYEEEGRWRTSHEIRIEYDVGVRREQIALNLPPGARVIDPADAFSARCSLERALFQIEVGGLILAVHDLRPLEHGEGYYVVSSVRGTPEHLRAFPPKRRWINSEQSALDVADLRSGAWMMEHYDGIEMARAAYEGVQVSWWLIVPRRFIEMVDGKRVEIETIPRTEPRALDDIPGKVRLPLLAIYSDSGERVARGLPAQVSQWVEVPLPSEHTATTLQDVAGWTRRDLLLMRHGSVWDMYGFTPGPVTEDRPLDHFEPDKVSDAEFAVAVQRVIDSFRALDESKGETPPGAAPPPP